MGFLRGALAQSSGCRLPLCRSGSPGLHALCLSGPKLGECPAPLPPHNESTVGQHFTVEDTYIVRARLSGQGPAFRTCHHSRKGVALYHFLVDDSSMGTLYCTCTLHLKLLLVPHHLQALLLETLTLQCLTNPAYSWTQNQKYGLEINTPSPRTNLSYSLMRSIRPLQQTTCTGPIPFPKKSCSK